jgi:hypothetical protein
MQTVGIRDPDLVGLAEDTVRTAECISEPTICARLQEIALELRELALPIPD